ncbi:proline--tRNA ligase [Lacipirellula limnantheis]|uniref:Proline--tRNA ligase n=1 Tax=Lacipirellula limnantheis TaxID=2528024 RepID=A0A517U452_9BACT|nr:proline--tRNA ligase [Lacipirellula limnantheis]QDT75401.1 Proline--tRNA ligase [Lacipirellula limnantheis]
MSGKTAITPTRSENYPEWYQQVVKGADLAENSDVRGCMVIKPWGYAIWENIQRRLDAMFKATGHENAYFPLFIPMSFLEKEAEHVEGFAKECAVVTHHRLEPNGKGGLRPAPSAELEEPLIVRPTSETIIGATFARWVQSYRDLPILINQWANVVRWELRTRMFLRTTEFLWQEGHTVHATAEEAQIETRQMLDVYAEFAEGSMAMPVIKGEKTSGERFPGAVSTYSIEAMMQDRKALQAGTSHFLGQNFAKAQEIKFQSEAGQLEYAWTTSWGVSTRLIGGLIMTHSDDDGLVLPPKLAPAHVIILPIYKTPEERAKVVPFCEGLKKDLGSQQYAGEAVRVRIDDRDIRGGDKKWQWVKRGVPIRLEIGPRDIADGKLFPARRDGVKYETKPTPEEFVASIAKTLAEMQQGLFDRAAKLRDEATVKIDTLAEFEKFFTPKNADNPEIHGGLAYCHFVDSPEIEEKLKELKVTVRCVPLDGESEAGTCIFTGKPSTKRGVFAKSY